MQAIVQDTYGSACVPAAGMNLTLPEAP